MILGLAHDDLTPLLQSARGPEPQPQKHVRRYNERCTRSQEIAIRKEAIALDRPEDEEWRDARQHHEESRDLQALNGAGVFHAVLATCEGCRHPEGNSGPTPRRHPS